MLDRLRQRLDLLPRGTRREAIEARRGVVICEYLAEYRKLCREVGPYAYATDLGLDLWHEVSDSGVKVYNVDGQLRTIAYAAAWHDMADDCDFIDEAIEAALQGFDDWQAEQETA